MNFSSYGYYGEDEQNQMSNNSSSSPTQPHKNLVPLTLFSQNPRGSSSNNNSWLDNEISSGSNNIRYYYNSTTRGGGGGGASAAASSSNLELMDASHSFRNHNNSDDDDVMIIRRAEDQEGVDTNSTAAAAGGAVVVEVEREHMFDKVVTPSDVGKLNRLVIPKQHAEKYFPLDSSTNEKGLLLNFEDRNGKPWRFRYSYWNSSQSYVMTKGWSRFVKEKKLDAGDIVSFKRGLGELGKDRLFIDWRRRPEIPPSPIPQHYLSFQRMSQPSSPWSSTNSTPLFLQPQTPSGEYSHFHHPNASAYVNQQPHYSTGNHGYGYGYGSSGGGGVIPYGTYNTNGGSSSHPCSSSVIYLRSTAAAAHVGSLQQLQAAGMVQLQSTSGGGGGGNMDIGSGVGAALPMVFESVPVVQGKAAAKRLRLFGVNMDCPISESDECDKMSSTPTVPNAATMPPWPHPPPYLSSSSSANSMHPLQLRLYNGSPVPTMHPDKGNASSKSFDLDI